MLHQAILTVIEEKVKDIQELVELGWAESKAIAQVRHWSVLGSKAWEEVLAQYEASK